MVQKTKALGEGLFDAGGSYKFTHEIKSLTPLGDNVLVRDMDFSGRQLSSGVILLGDDGKAEGIRPRWARVYAVGPEQTDVEAGQWILIEHGRWSRGLNVKIADEEFVLRRVDPKCIMFVSDDQPDLDDTISTAVSVDKKQR
jgi:co-chaperonin GroES (HSP10)